MTDIRVELGPAGRVMPRAMTVHVTELADGMWEIEAAVEAESAARLLVSPDAEAGARRTLHAMAAVAPGAPGGVRVMYAAGRQHLPTGGVLLEVQDAAGRPVPGMAAWVDLVERCWTPVARLRGNGVEGDSGWAGPGASGRAWGVELAGGWCGPGGTLLDIAVDRPGAVRIDCQLDGRGWREQPLRRVAAHLALARLRVPLDTRTVRLSFFDEARNKIGGLDAALPLAELPPLGAGVLEPDLEPPAPRAVEAPRQAPPVQASRAPAGGSGPLLPLSPALPPSALGPTGPFTGRPMLSIADGGEGALHLMLDDHGLVAELALARHGELLAAIRPPRLTARGPVRVVVPVPDRDALVLIARDAHGEAIPDLTAGVEPGARRFVGFRADPAVWGRVLRIGAPLDLRRAPCAACGADARVAEAVGASELSAAERLRVRRHAAITPAARVLCRECHARIVLAGTWRGAVAAARRPAFLARCALGLAGGYALGALLAAPALAAALPMAYGPEFWGRHMHLSALAGAVAAWALSRRTVTRPDAAARLARALPDILGARTAAGRARAVDRALLHGLGALELHVYDPAGAHLRSLGALPPEGVPGAVGRAAAARTAVIEHGAVTLPIRDGAVYHAPKLRDPRVLDDLSGLLEVMGALAGIDPSTD